MAKLIVFGVDVLVLPLVIDLAGVVEQVRGVRSANVTDSRAWNMVLVEVAVELLFASAVHDVTRDVVMVDPDAIGLVGVELGRVGSVDTGSGRS